MGETGCSNDDQVFIIDDDDDTECAKTPERNDQATNVKTFEPINKDSSEPEETNAIFEKINKT